MLELLKKYFDIQRQKSPYLYFLQNLFALGLLIALLLLPRCLSVWPNFKDIYVNLIASLLGFLLGALFLGALGRKLNKREDQQKVCYDDAVLEKQYGEKYRLRFPLHPDGKMALREKISYSYTPADGGFWDRGWHRVKKTISRIRYFFIAFWPYLLTRSDHARVYAEPLLKTGDNWAVKDNPETVFEPSEYIRSMTPDIMTAHGNSMRGNASAKTFRLKDCREEKGKKILETTRGTYLAHLLTNRAIDYQIRGKVSLRELYENTNCLTPLPESEFANHIGVNALVFLEDRKYILLPERDNTGTIAKEMLTASLATRLKRDDMSAQMTREYIEKDAVLNYLAEAIEVHQDWLDGQKGVSVRFLGLARDIYEGGKPTLFYAVNLSRCTAAEYMEEHFSYKSENPTDPNTIDRVKHIHVALWHTVRMTSPRIGRSRDKLVYKALRHYKYWVRSEKMVKPCEKNLLTAFWFLGQIE